MHAKAYVSYLFILFQLHN